eukprot:PhF_6_TR23278/c0_g1_i1/m.32769/K10609/CUL4; cullin 4
MSKTNLFQSPVSKTPSTPTLLSSPLVLGTPGTNTGGLGLLQRQGSSTTIGGIQGGAPKRISVVLPSTPATFETKWRGVVQDTVDAILHEKPVSFSLESVYRTLEDVRALSSGYSDVEDLLGKTLKVHCPKTFSPSHNTIATLSLAWRKHQTHVQLLALLCPNHKVSALALHIVKEYFAEGSAENDGLMKLFLNSIAAIRGGGSCEEDALQIQKVMVAIGHYNIVYTTILSTQCTEHYLAVSQREQPTNAARYLQEIVEPSLRLERHIQSAVLPWDVATSVEWKDKPSLVTITVQCVLWNVWETLLKHLNELFDVSETTTTTTASLANLYQCVKGTVHSDELRTAWRGYLAKSLGEIVSSSPSTSAEYVSALTNFHTVQHDLVLAKCFENELHFAQTFRDSFEKAMGAPHVDVLSKHLAMHYDRLLSASEATSAGSGTSTVVDDATLPLVRLLPTKDSFEAHYKILLARRLLLLRSKGNDIERDAILKFRAELGTGFTQKTEGMLKDVENSKDLQQRFNECGPLTVNVLADGMWPSMGIPWERIPEDMSRYIRQFETAYKGAFANRVLSWRHVLSTVQMRYIPVRKELVVSLSQCLALLALDEMMGESPALEWEGATMDEIKAMISIPPTCETGKSHNSNNSQQAVALVGLRSWDGLQRELDAIMASLVAAKLVLSSAANSKGNTTPTTPTQPAKYKLNETYTHRQNKVRVAAHHQQPNLAGPRAIQRKEDQERDEAIGQAIQLDRTHALDATVVRLMKSRRKMHHTELVTGVLGMCKFPVQPVDVKKRIESLIDREYLKRDDNDPGIYQYIS